MTATGGLGDDGQFPERLRRARIAAGLTQKELSTAAGLPKFGFRTIQEWENGRSHPRSGGHLKKIAEALDVTIAWLLWGEENL
jgi:transcriptional regulator with XRE-family HTH domain